MATTGLSAAVEPARSPLLRRPDLLVSLITYWQHHPALSYAFAGRFVGPTSQAPRVDEGRPETLSELETAFAEIERLADLPDDPANPDHRPWLVDRALRQLLTDITGNTHRSEFCVDKLYSPDSARGRLGLLELRGFEMPPTVDLALVQALLIRAIVARCAEDRYAAPLIRWGSRLHERYLLPYFMAVDLAEVVADLRRHDFSFELGWLQPFLDFRCPVLGRAEIDSGSSGPVELELRTAIEPWHVLGQESSSGGTARYVDSSTERLQVLVRGFDRERFLLTCNGHPVPLTPTDRGLPVRRRSAVQGLEPVVRPAPDPAARRPAHLRSRRPGRGTVAGRRSVPRRAPGWVGLGAATGERARGRGPPRPAVRVDGSHYGGDRRRRRWTPSRPGVGRAPTSCPSLSISVAAGRAAGVVREASMRLRS